MNFFFFLYEKKGMFVMPYILGKIRLVDFAHMGSIC